MIDQARLQKGRVLLNSVLPLATKRAATRVADAQLPNFEDYLHDTFWSHARPEKLDALVVQKIKGGWVADVVLKDMPANVGTTFGTPPESPLPTEAEAIEDGISLIAEILLQATARRVGPIPEESDHRMFCLYGEYFALKKEEVENIKTTQEFSEDVDPFEIMAEIDEEISHVVHRGVLDRDAFFDMPKDDQNNIAFLMGYLMLIGIRQYPLS